MGKILALTALIGLWVIGLPAAPKKINPEDHFQTSDRCIACHNGLTTKSGEDISIGFNWRATMMANSSRDPYWQAGVRREIIDHPKAQKWIEEQMKANPKKEWSHAERTRTTARWRTRVCRPCPPHPSPRHWIGPGS